VKGQWTCLFYLAPAWLAAVSASPELVPEQPPNFIAGRLIELNDNGAWSWFMDDRAIVDDGKLIVGSVRAVGSFRSGNSDPDWGNVEVCVLNIAAGTVKKTVLHRHFEQDDHDSPAFLVLPDRRILAVYSKHSVERKVYSRISEPGDPLTWGPVSTFETPGVDRPAFGGNNVTYSNLFRMPNGRIYNFFRGFNHDPNVMSSEDSGRSWMYAGHLLRGRGGYSPYLKYAFDGKDTIYFVTTDDHPRNYDNSVYSGFLRDGIVYLSDGTPRGKLSGSTSTDLVAWEFTRLFQGGPDNRAWVTDLKLDREKRPCLVFTVHKDGRGLPPGRGGMDHRFYYGRWDGSAWQVHEIAYAGTRLYAGEDDYTGLAALDPNDPDVVYISTNADPVTGSPLVSAADQRRHHELFRGTTRDAGKTWKWEPITANSTIDNLRPIVPKWSDSRTALIWMRGSYKNNHGEWSTAVVALILPRRPKE
jgi:hypothetical protein